MAKIALVVYVSARIVALVMKVVEIVSSVLALLQDLQELTSVLRIIGQKDLPALIDIRSISILVDSPAKRAAKEIKAVNYLKHIAILGANRREVTGTENLLEPISISPTQY